MRLDHVSVTVGDLERALAFYRDLLALPVLGVGEEEGYPLPPGAGAARARFRFADIDMGAGQLLELLQYLAPRGVPLRQRVWDPGSGHVAVRVQGLDRLLERLAAAGFPPRFPPTRLTDVPPWWQGARVVYVTDPDGVTVELVERPEAPAVTADARSAAGPSPRARRRASARAARRRRRSPPRRRTGARSAPPRGTGTTPRPP